MTVTELANLAAEAAESLLAMRAGLPSDHPLQADVSSLLDGIYTLERRTIAANETYRKKLPV